MVLSTALSLSEQSGVSPYLPQFLSAPLGPKRPIFTDTVLPVSGSLPKMRSPILCVVFMASVFSTEGWN